MRKKQKATSEQVTCMLGIFQRKVDSGDAQSAINSIRSQGRARVVTFTGFSGTGYEDETDVREVILREFKNFDPSDTLVCAGATPEGIGMVYPVALQQGFRTAGIVSSLARTEGASLSTECEVVFVVDDTAWGGKQGNGRLSPTSQAMVDACDVMIGIGGGAIARDELAEALKKGKVVRFHKAEMNHALAAEKATKAGNEPPLDFIGEAQLLFPDQQQEDAP